MKTQSIQETTRQFPSLLMEIEQPREPVMICRNGKPIAELTPLPHRSRLQPHPIMSRIEIRYDPVAPLEADEWTEYGIPVITADEHFQAHDIRVIA